MSTNAENPTNGSGRGAGEDTGSGEGTGTGEGTGAGEGTGTGAGEGTTAATVATEATTTVSVAPGRPHIRWGGVVWGAVLLAIAGFVLFTVSSHARQSAFDSWVAGLTPGTVWTLAVVAVGVFILILALLAVVRGAQRNRRA